MDRREADPGGAGFETAPMPAEWRRFVAGLPLAGSIRPVILRSWERSRAAGVAADTGTIPLRRIDEAELRARLAGASELVAVAGPHLEALSVSLRSTPHAAYLTDADGIVLLSRGDSSLQERFGLTPGHDWSENAMGTNGAGTALATGQPVAVIGPEHFGSAFHDCTCTGAPIRVEGRIVGALDVSTSVVDAEPGRLAVVAHLAFVIGAELARRDAARRESKYQQLTEGLRASEARFRAVVETFPSAVAIYDRDRRFQYVNRAGARRTGIAPERYLGKCDEELFPARVTDAYLPALIEALRTGAPQTTESAIELATGHYAVVVTYVPIKDEAGRIREIVGVASDITEHRQIEEMLREADRRKDEFLATLAHELRNPLAPIRHATRVAKSPEATPGQVNWSLDVIDRQVEHMARLLDDLLEASRISRGKLELRTQRTDLAAAVVVAAETARPLVESRQHSLSLELPSEPAWLVADPVRLAQVFTNLLTNAAKYTDPRGTIVLRLSREERHAVVSVRDTGIGLGPEMLPRMFQMFSQAEPALDRVDGGLGIGLALARGLVELHGGTIEARSDGPGRGSEFIVRLPLADLPAENEPPAVPAEPRASVHHRVLVVDDNRDSAESLAMLLRLDGHQAQIAYDGQSALELAASFRPSVAVLDIGMPGLNGYEVAKRLRSAPGGQKMMLIAVTGWGKDEDKRRALGAGFDHHLTKPVDPARLSELIASQGPALPSRG